MLFPLSLQQNFIMYNHIIDYSANVLLYKLHNLRLFFFCAYTKSYLCFQTNSFMGNKFLYGSWKFELPPVIWLGNSYNQLLQRLEDFCVLCTKSYSCRAVMKAMINKIHGTGTYNSSSRYVDSFAFVCTFTMRQINNEWKSLR